MWIPTQFRHSAVKGVPYKLSCFTMLQGQVERQQDQPQPGAARPQQFVAGNDCQAAVYHILSLSNAEEGVHADTVCASMLQLARCGYFESSVCNGVLAVGHRCARLQPKCGAVFACKSQYMDSTAVILHCGITTLQYCWQPPAEVPVLIPPPPRRSIRVATPWSHPAAHHTKL